MTYTVVKQLMIVITAINFAACHLGESNYKKLRTSNTFYFSFSLNLSLITYC